MVFLNKFLLIDFIEIHFKCNLLVPHIFPSHCHVMLKIHTYVYWKPIIEMLKLAGMVVVVKFVWSTTVKHEYVLKLFTIKITACFAQETAFKIRAFFLLREWPWRAISQFWHGHLTNLVRPCYLMTRDVPPTAPWSRTAAIFKNKITF